MHDRGHQHEARGGPNSHHAERAPETQGGTGGHHTNDVGPSQEWFAFAGWDAALTLLALAALVGFALFVWRSRRGLYPPAAFVAGVAVAYLAAASPLCSLVARGSHLAFMVQFELLINVAPPLIVLGSLPLLAKGSPAFGLAGVAPVFGLGIWLLAMYLPHLPAVHALVLGSPVAYALQLAGFAVAGTLFWSLIVGSGGMRLRGKLAYLALAQVGAGLLAAFLIWSPGLLYGHQHGALPFGLSAAADQRLSGVVMMVVDMLSASTAAGWLFVRAAGGTPGRLLRATAK